MQLQNTWVSGVVGGGGGRGGFGGRGGRGVAPRTPKPVTAVVTTADGQRFEGPLQRIDDFIVVIADPDGLPRTFRRAGGNPKIEITDPLDGHKKLWVKLTDKDMHDVTAYLVTLK
jgi:cytochrome c oxidase cbb3-type subunit 3